jgi:cellulose synthase/poly-beta-1,6-N-acetylglucosamine synthase-like glycosyltransferase
LAVGILDIAGRLADIFLIVLLTLQCFLGYRLTSTLMQHDRSRRAGLERERDLLNLPLPPDADLPAVIVQIPTFNEGALVWRVLAAVTAFDWPHDRLHVQVLDDSTDESAEVARTAVREFQRRGHNVTLIQRSVRSGFKAGALKAGLAHSNEPFIAMFDADYVPRPDFLRQCFRAMLADPNIAFVQARCDFLNAFDNRITRAQKIILDSHFVVEQATRYWVGQILPFNGTCGIWRRAAIEASGGWQGDTLTEDLDLSYRAQLAGWQAKYLVSVGAPGELPATLAAWKKQQLRWNTGYAQTARKLLPSIWRSTLPWNRKFAATLHLTGCIFGLIFVVEDVLWVADFALGTMSYWIVLPLAGVGMLQALTGAIGMALHSQNLLQKMGPQWQTMGRWETCKMALFTIWMHSHAGMTTAWGVLKGLRGSRSTFERTPKKGSLATEMRGEAGTTGMG